MLIVGGGGGGAGAPPGGPAAQNGGGAPVLSSWQFTTAGIVHLPVFELHGPLPASAAAREFLGSQPDAGPGGAAGAARGQALGQQRQQQQQQPQRLLWAEVTPVAPPAIGSMVPPPPHAQPAAQQPGAPTLRAGCGVCGACGASEAARRAAGVWLLRMYGRVYLAHVARRGGGGAPDGGGGSGAGARLELYRFYSDTLLLERLYDLVNPQVCVGDQLCVTYLITQVGTAAAFQMWMQGAFFQAAPGPACGGRHGGSCALPFSLRTSSDLSSVHR
jgi:hypothetical protein